jgi:hypothetical protein
MRIAYRYLAPALALVVLLAASLARALDVPVPQEQRQGSIAYVAGGIGSGEADAMRRVAASYPLTLELAAPGDGWRDEFIAGARVEIDDLGGRALLATRVDGPLLLVRLPPGSYALQVAWNGAVKRKNVTIASGERRQHIVFEFPHAER